MKNFSLTLGFALIGFFTSACNKPASDSASSRTTENQAPAEQTKAAARNQLRMKINGELWQADNEIFGAFHPKGYNKAIMIAGSKGANNAEQQNFNINLFNADGPGVYQIKDGNPDNSVAQLANLSTERFIYGSMMGFEMRVTISEAQSNPGTVEATFDGELTGNAGDKIKITEGRFSYRE